jgi:hypothetical protein
MIEPLSENNFKAELSEILLAHGNRWMTILELADEVNQRGKYQKKDKSALTHYDVHLGAMNYPMIFQRAGANLRLSNPSLR